MSAILPSRRAMSAREVALHVARDVFGETKRSAREALDYRLRHAALDARDRAFATELAYGAIKMRRLLNWHLQTYIGERMAKLPPAIAEILRLGAYQLRVMRGVEAYAAVSESVGLAKRYGHRGTANLVNAVLRRLAEAPERLPERDAFASEDDYLGVTFSLPTWIVAHWRRRFGDALLPQILAGVDATPPLGLRVNLWRASAGEVCAELGVPAHRSAVARESIVLDAFVSAAEVDERARGRYGIQAEAACFPVDVLDPQPDDLVVEYCSGRGNKTLQIVGRIEDRGRVEAREIDERKVRRARAALAEAEAASAEVLVADATVVEADLPKAAGILVDAPCSGLGILGRQPEARWRKTPEDSERLAPLQRALLESAVVRVAPGGILVYSVCTSDPREGEEAAAFVRERPEFRVRRVPERYARWEREDGSVLIPPGIDGLDGFFIAAFERVA